MGLHGPVCTFSGQRVPVSGSCADEWVLPCDLPDVFACSVCENRPDSPSFPDRFWSGCNAKSINCDNHYQYVGIKKAFMRKASEGRSFVRPCRSGMSGTVRDMLSGRVEGHAAGE